MRCNNQRPLLHWLCTRFNGTKKKKWFLFFFFSVQYVTWEAKQQFRINIGHNLLIAWLFFLHSSFCLSFGHLLTPLDDRQLKKATSLRCIGLCVTVVLYKRCDHGGFWRFLSCLLSFPEWLVEEWKTARKNELNPSPFFFSPPLCSFFVGAFSHFWRATPSSLSSFASRGWGKR